MREIENKISPLISGLFPSFYQEDGPNFIAFVKAYYEWLEQNFQLLDLESIENFKVGDIVTQDNVTGEIFAVIDNSILVLVDGLETFKCLNICSEIIPVTSSSGGNTSILRGGQTRRMGALFLSRNLLNIRDIDETIDLFVVRFKEKYLKNIEFDTQTNKRLLVKNSLDLYRSKGTSRSIDLFFRLIYGVGTSVYYPGEDLFRLSDAEWYRPQFIEINSSSSDRAISLVGKQVTGINSGATAFIERYIKQRVKSDIVHILYVSNVRGTFFVNERIKGDQLYDDSPTIVGSLTGASIGNGSERFAVGDLIDIESRLGDNAIGRVASTVRGNGQVSFDLLDRGWGYTTNAVQAPGGVSVNSANTFLSDKILSVSNVNIGRYIVAGEVEFPGSGYSNSNIVIAQSDYNSARFRLTTNNSGAVTSVKLLERGSGYFPGEPIPLQTPSTAGTGLSLRYTFDYPKSYYSYLEDLSQPSYTTQYTSPQYIDQFGVGDRLTIGTTGGTLLEIDTVASTMRISLDTKQALASGQIIRRVANNQSSVTAGLPIVKLDTIGKIIDISPSASLVIGQPDGIFRVDDVVYQAENNVVVAQATVTRASNASGGILLINNHSGVFRVGQPLNVFGRTTSATLTSVSLDIAVAATSNTFLSLGGTPVYTDKTGFNADVISATSGSNARYRIATISDAETVLVNNNRLNNTTILNTDLNASQYSLPANTSANAASVIFGALTFVDLNIGSIRTLGEIGPGLNYTRDPVTSVFQPNITGYHARDYIMTVSGATDPFIINEYIVQQQETQYSRIYVANSSVYRKGELVHAANTSTNFVANGIVNDIDVGANYIEIIAVQGTAPNNTNYTIKSLISNANSQIVNTSSFARQTNALAIIKSVSDNKIFAKRIQLENKFRTLQTVRGERSGEVVTLTSIDEDPDTRVAGLNAVVDAEASTASGRISGVQIVDSGFAFSNDTGLTFTSRDGDGRSGTLTGSLGGVGIRTGYYRNTKGFVSDLSKIHDGDYYQEYSYDILSRIPLDKYSEMFKKAIHVAGTRFFGSVLIDTLATVGVTGADVANSSIEITDDTPYVIQDRFDIDVIDRDRFFIEIREF